jgi:hypothetical protein
MAVPFQTYDAVGNREDLTDIIYDISPTDTPFISTVGKSKAKATYHEWQTDNLADATADNAVVEGADATFADLAPTTRVGNYTQILRKTVTVSNTQDVVDKAGRNRETAYQLTKASKEIKRDLEMTALSNNVADAGSDATPRKMAGIQTWLTTNTVDGAGGAFTEDMLKDAVKQAFESGGTPTMLLVTPTQKQVVSEFTGIAGQRYMAPKSSPTTIIGAADIYLSDFGALSVVPDRFLTPECALVIDPSMYSMAYLRPFTQQELAKTGDSTKHMMLTEVKLQVKNEASSAIISNIV